MTTAVWSAQVEDKETGEIKTLQFRDSPWVSEESAKIALQASVVHKFKVLNVSKDPYKYR